MFRFDWHALATPAVIGDLESMLETRSKTPRARLVALLGPVLQAVGGLPLAHTAWDAAHQRAVALKLVHEATLGLLRRGHGLGFAGRGVVLGTREGATVAHLHDRLDPNRASAEQLEALDVLGPALASEIVTARRQQGRFRSLADLARRVSGLGPVGSQRLADVLVFPADTAAVPVAPGELAVHLRRLAALAPRTDSLADVLEELTVFCAGDPHPATRLGRKRDDLEPEAFAAARPPEAMADRVELLEDGAYYSALPLLLAGATARLDVCLFFLALGGDDHPTRRLADALVARAQAGCQVRVLLDRDDIGDPYGSRYVNSAAAQYLSQRGVTVHHDRRERLLHSKFVLLDDTRMVIGSHNWTAGSYFSYRDLSFVIDGADVVASWRTRFEALWAQSFPYAARSA